MSDLLAGLTQTPRQLHLSQDCTCDPATCIYCKRDDERAAKRHAANLARGWKQETCGHCRGYGVVSDYAGGDFNGAKDCSQCAGGIVWVTPSGKHHALYPGGPFVD
jgi:hypothetical protein